MLFSTDPGSATGAWLYIGKLGIMDSSGNLYVSDLRAYLIYTLYTLQLHGLKSRDIAEQVYRQSMSRTLVATVPSQTSVSARHAMLSRRAG
jgi:hypothetical protein